MTVAKRQPELALLWWPFGAAPKAALANRMVIVDGEIAPDKLDRAEHLATDALIREPVSVDALRALALVAARRGNVPAADRFFSHAEKLSRRDFATELWMIEKEVRDNRIPAALKHYDHALRTSRSASDVLLPTLVSAADDPTILPALGQRLSSRPNWWQGFLARAIKDVKDSRALLALSDSLKIDATQPSEATFVQQILERLIRDGRYAEALAYHRRLAGRGARPALLSDGEFDSQVTVPPFDWWLRNESDLSAAKEISDTGNVRLMLYASGGRGGEVARQLVALKPGSYRISGRTGDTGVERRGTPVLQLRCMDKQDVLSAALPARAGEGAPFGFTFTVPAERCPAQWLSILTAPAEETQAWIDGLEIQALPN